MYSGKREAYTKLFLLHPILLRKDFWCEMDFDCERGLYESGYKFLINDKCLNSQAIWLVSKQPMKIVIYTKIVPFVYYLWKIFEMIKCFDLILKMNLIWIKVWFAFENGFNHKFRRKNGLFTPLRFANKVLLIGTPIPLHGVLKVSYLIIGFQMMNLKKVSCKIHKFNWVQTSLLFKRIRLWISLELNWVWFTRFRRLL